MGEGSRARLKYNQGRHCLGELIDAGGGQCQVSGAAFRDQAQSTECRIQGDNHAKFKVSYNPQRSRFHGLDFE